MKNNLSEELEFEIKSDYDKKWKIALKIYKSNWSEVKIYIGLWFIQNEYKDAEIVLIKSDALIENKDIATQLYSDEKEKKDKYSKPERWTFANQSLVEGDFIEFMLENSVEKGIEKVTEIIKKFVELYIDRLDKINKMQNKSL